MKLIIGLGNPGKEYEKTRHNVGWLVLDALEENDQWQTSKKANAMFIKKAINGVEVELLKPTTYMNESGRAACYAQKKHHLNPADIWVVHDDIDLPLGKIRIGQFNSSAGHKGVQSIIDHLKSADFIRFRIGIKNDVADKQPADKFVLQKFNLTEKKKINESIKKTTEAIEMLLAEPLEKVMNKFN